MTDLAAKERAIRSLSAQIDQLGEVRNAGTRDPNFKLWRQSTLTLIQRLWPGDDTRSTRFRRVPFSPPSTRADQRSTREWYERGCGEVLQLLRSLLEEIETEGLPAARKSTGASSSGTSEAEEVYPTLSLPGSGGSPAETRGSSEIPRLPESPNAGPSSASANSMKSPGGGSQADSPHMPAELTGRESSHSAPAHSQRSGHTGGKNASRGPRNGRRGAAKPRLKDLLGFGDESAIAGVKPPDAPATPEVSSVAAAPISEMNSRDDAPIAEASSRDDAPMAEANSRDDAPMAEASSRDDAPMAEVKPPDVPPISAPEPFEVPPMSAPPMLPPLQLRLDPEFESHTGAEEANDRALQSALEAALEPIFEQDAGRAAAEFLQNSPVFRARPRGVEPRAVPANEAFKSPAAIAVAAIAAEVTALGVAEGNRAQVRAALLDMAGQLDQHAFTWDALREAVTFVMQFPPVGRRVLPLLIPYLDEAA